MILRSIIILNKRTEWVRTFITEQMTDKNYQLSRNIILNILNIILNKYYITLKYVKYYIKYIKKYYIKYIFRMNTAAVYTF